MSRSIEISGKSVVYLFYVVSMAALVSIVRFVALPLDGPGSVALAVLFVILVLTGIVGFWRRYADREGEHLGTADDIAYDPIADPGQAAKHGWVKAIRRLPPGGGDDEE